MTSSSRRSRGWARCSLNPFPTATCSSPGSSALGTRRARCHFRELIAYGAGWTDPERQQPVGDTGRHEPRHVDAIIEVELERALADPDPLRGIAQLTARWAAAFVLDPAGVTRTKALGTDSIARKLRDALPGGEGALRGAVWDFMRPMLSPSTATRSSSINESRRPSTSMHTERPRISMS